MTASPATATIRVAIVDDEHLVRLGIQSYLDDSAGRYDVVGAYADGNSALQGLRAERAAGRTVDVLLTDIKMPVMDGIELTAQCRSEDLVSHVVVLSCHDEFELVRKAFTCGADEYVLKHEVEQNELLNVLARIIGSHNSQPDRRSMNSLQQDTSHRDGIDSAKVWESRARSWNETLPAIVTAYRFCNEYSPGTTIVPWQPDVLALDREISAASDSLGPAIHVPFARGGVIVFQLRAIDEAVPERRVRKACEKIMTRVRRYWNREMQFLIQPTPRELSFINHAVQHEVANAVWEQGIYHPGDTVIMANSEHVNGDDTLEIPYLHLGERKIPEMWDDAVAEYLEHAKRALLPASHVYLSLSGMLHQVDRDLLHTIGKTLHEVINDSPKPLAVESDIPGSIVQRLEAIDSVDVLKRWLHNLFERVNAALSHASIRVSRVGRVLSYLDETYKQPLDLDALAERFSISKAYLCSRVREETGLTLSQHINQRRIARARELLRTTRMSAKEICFAVGYDNPNYFSRVFRAVSGESVTAFRNAVNR